MARRAGREGGVEGAREFARAIGIHFPSCWLVTRGLLKAQIEIQYMRDENNIQNFHIKLTKIEQGQSTYDSLIKNISKIYRKYGKKF